MLWDRLIGRTTDLDSVNLGSNPSPRSKRRKRSYILFVIWTLLCLWLGAVIFSYICQHSTKVMNKLIITYKEIKQSGNLWD